MKRQSLGKVHYFQEAPHAFLVQLPHLDRLLTQRLNELVDADMIEKEYINDSVKKTKYRLTENGQAFKEVIHSIQKWVHTCQKTNQCKEPTSPNI